MKFKTSDSVRHKADPKVLMVVNWSKIDPDTGTEIVECNWRHKGHSKTEIFAAHLLEKAGPRVMGVSSVGRRF